MNDLAQLETLGRTIVRRVEKGDRATKDAEGHYLAAGLHLKEAQSLVKRRADMNWLTYLNRYVPLQKTRVYELIAIADGRTTVAELRAAKAATVAATRSRNVPLRSGKSVEKTQENQARIEPDEKSILMSSIAARLPALSLDQIKRVHGFVNSLK